MQVTDSSDPSAASGSLTSWICWCSVLIVSVIFALPAAAFAQVDRAGLTGTVTDSSGQVLSGVHVTAIQDDTGLTRETFSSDAGTYDVPELPVGRYTVKFGLTGFQQISFTNVIEAVGQTRTLDAVLSPAGMNETIEISGASTQIDETNDALGQRIERKQVEDLPLNGRNWATLTALVPGAIDTGGSNQRTIYFAGRGLDDNNFTSDGVDATNIVNQAQQPFVRLAIPTDTIEEFRIDAMLFTAESGSTPGGQVAVTTPSGTNQFHGDVFEFLRNDVFDARNFFNPNPNNPPFRLNQFGGSLGGPIVPGKTFFFISYEGLRQALGQSLTGFVPSDAFRADVLAESPALAPVINAFPHGQTLISPQVAEFFGEGNQVDNEDSGMMRIDQHFSDTTTAFVRFNLDSAVSIEPLVGSGTQYLSDRQEITSSPASAVIEVLHVFSPNLVDEGKFGFNRGTVFTTNLGQNGLPYSVAVSGLTTENNDEERSGVGNSFSWIDNVTWIKNKHVIKSGVEIRRIQLNQGNTANGSVSFDSLSAFAADQVNAASFAAPLPVNGLRKTEYYGFIQDEYKLKPNLTVNLGVRYTFYNMFHEVLGRAIPFDFATCGPQGFCPPGSSFGRPNTRDIDPRGAIAWAPAGLKGKTVIRAGAGIYHGDGQLDDQNLPTANEVDRFALSEATIPNLSFPIAPFLADTVGIVSPRDMNRLWKDMYVSQWGLSVQQSLAFDMVATVSYIGSKGTHLLTTSYINTIDPETGKREFPDFGQVEYRGNDNNSEFQGLQASLQRSFAHGLVLSANYLWSHEIDDGSVGGGDADFPEDPECRSCARASGDFDVRQTFHVSLVYELPFGPGKPYIDQPGIARALLGSWEVA
ncbi:MAG TPA: TonB-dependent receptor, partial [Blastocatellia bacterium]